MTDCKRPVSQDQSQSSFGSSEFFWETASDTGGDFYKQPARGSAGGSRRKQRRMKEGAEVGEREVAWTSPSISQSHFQTAAKPAGPSSHHHLSDCWGGLRWGDDDFWWICLCLPAWPLQVGSSNKHVHLPDPFVNFSEQNEKNAVKLIQKTARPPFSEAWKVISDRTCQGVYGRFTQSYEKERTEPGD